MSIRELHLQTGHLAEQKVFYAEQLGLPLIRETRDTATIRCGETVLTFMQAQNATQPFYHFAFNIAENKLLQAKQWLAEQHIALSQDDPQNMYSASWNSHAFYFYDAGGNIVEFIARHRLPTARSGPFTISDVLYASEIGLVTDNVLFMVDQLKRAFDVEVYKGSASDTFTALGDEYALFIIVKRGRVWLASDKQAQVFPTEVTLEVSHVAEDTQEIDVIPYPYHLHVACTSA